MRSGPCNLYHGSHPMHRFGKLPSQPHGELCSVCRAAAFSTDDWFLCEDPACNFLLCSKCFSVSEELLHPPKVVILSPMASPCAAASSVRTRPRPDSYCIAPVYPAKLMEVVSRAACTAGTGAHYFRLAEGGWICAHDVLVCDVDYIAMLADYHLRAHHCGGAAPALPLERLTQLIEQSLLLFDPEQPYSPSGLVMASLTLYPLVRTVSEPADADAVEAYAGGILRFLFDVIDYAVSQLRYHMDEGEPPLTTTTLPSLYTDVLASCLAALAEMGQQWRVDLPPAFAAVLLDTVTLMAREAALLRDYGDGAARDLRIAVPAVPPQPHVSLGEELRRVFYLSQTLVVRATMLLRRLPCQPGATGESLRPLRALLAECDLEVPRKAFCELLAHLIASDPAAHQDAFLDLDPLEVVAAIARRAQLAESQVAAYRLVECACWRHPGNIAVTAAAALPQLMRMARHPASAAVMAAALRCFTALAHNEPRLEGLVAGDTRCLCAGAPPARTPFERMHVYSVETEHGTGLLALCGACAGDHPPAGASPAAGLPPQFAYFSCQCPACDYLRSASETREGGCPVVDIPQTSAARGLFEHGVAALVSDWLHREPGLVADDVGMLALKLPLGDPILAALTVFLCGAAIDKFPVAALAVAAHRGRPCVREQLRRHSTSALTRYVASPAAGSAAAITAAASSTPVKRHADPNTPSPLYSQRRSDLGLSPSSHNSTFQQSTLSDYGHTAQRLYHCE